MKSVSERIKETKEKIDSLGFDVHWYRRVFHAFGASFLIYYMLPDEKWINALKLWIPIIILSLAVIIEILRITGKISSDHFFGLRFYEKNRVGSYLFFGMAVLLLLVLFPQQIAIPCILCGCLGDPIIGEIRNNYGKKQAVLIGFLVCMIFFIIAWHNVDLWLIIFLSIFGAGFAVIGEMKKIWWLDDDFMIQILPAIMLFLLILFLNQVGLSIGFENIIHPGEMPW